MFREESYLTRFAGIICVKRLSALGRVIVMVSFDIVSHICSYLMS